MSTLNKKIAAHLEEQFPPEFDEKWVSKLLTDKEPKVKKRVTKRKTPDHEKALLKDIALIEAEIRKQKIIRKANSSKAVKARKPVSKPPQKTNEPESMSAIEKQKKAHISKNQADLDSNNTPNKRNSRRLLSRLKKR